MKRNHYTSACPDKRQASNLVYTAMKLALIYRDRLPTLAELASEYGISTATATRWRKAMTMAMEDLCIEFKLPSETAAETWLKSPPSLPPCPGEYRTMSNALRPAL